MPKNQNSTLGKALKNQQKKLLKDRISKVQQVGQFIHESAAGEDEYQIQQRNLQSIIDQDTLNEYLQMAELANQKFVAERKAEIIKDEINVKQKDKHYNNQDQQQPQKQIIINVNALRQSGAINPYDQKNNDMMRNLRIPRRPEWNIKTSIQEMREHEGEAFLKWRKELAKFEEEHYTVHLTPYEKNIEVWKQLWRVVEKSDILVQVVDGRDPMFYRCEDLEKYILEPAAKPYNKNQTKQNFLLINKSDLLSEEIRKAWNKYNFEKNKYLLRFFIENNVNHMFFSAKLEQERIDRGESIVEQVKLDEIEEAKRSELMGFQFINTINVSNRESLLSELSKLVQIIRADRGLQQHQLPEQEEKKDQDLTQFNPNLVCIGMVGYPNVGKSSVINTLCNKKLVGVAARPGKTKHFQTIQLEKDIMLCDCPGLIFPNASSTRGEMVCNGVLPIDNMRDYLSPVDVLVQRIPKIVFEKLYGINLRDELQLESSIMLQAYSKKKGYVTGRGLPDEAKAARFVLKDFVNGRLLYCKLPPNFQGEIWQSNKVENLEELLEEQAEEEKAVQAQKNLEIQFNKETIGERVKLSNDDLMDIFTQEDLIELMDGKRVKGVKLTKIQRREIKFIYQRGEPIDLKKYLVSDSEKYENPHNSKRGKKVEIKY